MDESIQSMARQPATPLPAKQIAPTVQAEGGGGAEHRRETNEHCEASKVVIPEGGGEKDGQRFRSLELPTFDGEDPVGWLFKMERYFTANGVTETKKLDAATVGLEGRALNWFQWTETRSAITSWKEFKSEVLDKFHCLQWGDNYERLASLKQYATVTEYHDMFEMLSAPLAGIPNEILMGLFKNGLSEEVKADVRLMNPTTLKQLMDCAFQVKGRNLALKNFKEEKKAKYVKNLSVTKWGNNRNTPSRFSGFLEAPKTTSSSQNSKGVENKEGEGSKNTPNKVVIPITTTNSSSGSNRGSQRLSKTEINQRQELGLCFKCEEKYGPNHKCKGKQLKMLIITEEDVVEGDPNEIVDDEDDIPEKVFTAMRLKFSSMVGFTGCKTMKLDGELRGRQVVVLIDSDATHNFISSHIVGGLRIVKLWKWSCKALESSKLSIHLIWKM